MIFNICIHFLLIIEYLLHSLSGRKVIPSNTSKFYIHFIWPKNRRISLWSGFRRYLFHPARSLYSYIIIQKRYPHRNILAGAICIICILYSIYLFLLSLIYSENIWSYPSCWSAIFTNTTRYILQYLTKFLLYLQQICFSLYWVLFWTYFELYFLSFKVHYNVLSINQKESCLL